MHAKVEVPLRIVSVKCGGLGYAPVAYLDTERSKRQVSE